MSSMADESPAAQAAADLVAGAARLVEAPQGEQPATEQAEAAPELPSYEADLSGLDDILNDEPEDVVEEDGPPEETGEEFDEYDPDRAQAELKKLKKRLAWAEEQRVKQGVKNWRAEAEKRFPLADVDEINATSRRAFLKQAAAQHQRTEKKLKPILSQLEQLKGSAVEAVRQQERTDTANHWGPPTSGPAQPLVEEAGASQAEALDRRRYGSVGEMVRARFNNDPRFQNGV